MLGRGERGGYESLGKSEAEVVAAVLEDAEGHVDGEVVG